MRNELQSIDYMPPFIPSQKDPIGDEELGLPEIHKVNGAQTKDKATSQMREHTMVSLNLTEKIDLSLGASNVGANTAGEVSQDLSEMVRIASSPHRFDSPADFAEYLTEGILFNVNRFVSNALNVPVGEYLVYSMVKDYTKLIPTSDLSVQETDFTGKPGQFEVQTSRLLGCWNRAEKLLAEYADDEQPNEQPRPENKQSKNLQRRGKRQKIQDVAQGAYGNMKYARDADFRSEREAHDLSLDDIVNALGGDVHKSTVSRWGAAGGTPSNRVPSGEHMIKLAKMGIDPETFADKVGTGGSAGGVPTRGGGQISGS